MAAWRSVLEFGAHSAVGYFARDGMVGIRASVSVRCVMLGCLLTTVTVVHVLVLVSVLVAVSLLIELDEPIAVRAAVVATVLDSAVM